jgi:hypothetical protein
MDICDRRPPPEDSELDAAGPGPPPEGPPEEDAPLDEPPGPPEGALLEPVGMGAEAPASMGSPASSKTRRAESK